MEQWKSVDEVLDFAIGQEEQAHDFYMELAGKMQRGWMKEIFEHFAQEENGHKRKLLEIKSGKLLTGSSKKVLDLKLSEYLTDVEPGPEMDYQEALVVAMKKEKKAFKMYSDIAEATDDENLKVTFTMLAQEEAKHKLRFEVEYDDVIMSEN